MGWNVKHFHEHIRKQHGFRWGYTGPKHSCIGRGWWNARRDAGRIVANGRASM